jgi:hypothetical protein
MCGDDSSVLSCGLFTTRRVCLGALIATDWPFFQSVWHSLCWLSYRTGAGLGGWSMCLEKRTNSAQLWTGEGRRNPDTVHELFRLFRKIATSYCCLRHFCWSVRPSVNTVQLCSRWTNFHEIWYLSIFRNTVEKIQVSIKPDKNNGYFTWSPIYIFNNVLVNSS